MNIFLLSIITVVSIILVIVLIYVLWSSDRLLVTGTVYNHVGKLSEANLR